MVTTKKTNWKKIKKEVLQKIVPGKKTVLHEKKTVKEIKERLKKLCEKNTKIGVFGSFARNTHLNTEKDIDVFLLYPTTTKKRELEKKIIETGKKFFEKNYWLEYSEHPYIKGYYKKFLVELVPGYNLKNTKKLFSSVDRTPFHHYYLKNRFTKQNCNEVRLLKSFLKGIHCYGAKVSVSGFSGYLAELLILSHGSFISLLKKAAEWEEKTVVEIEKGDLKKSKMFNHHLVAVDPTDKNRNTAAAVSLKQYSRFVLACRKFLEKPSRKFFHVFTEKKSVKTIKKALKQRHFVFVEMPVPIKGLIDIVGAQQKKIHSKLEKKLNNNNFFVRKSRFCQGRKKLYHSFEFYSEKGPKSIAKTGPKATDKKNCEAFLKKHSKPVFGPWIKHGRLYLETKPKTNSKEAFLKQTIKKIAGEEKQPIAKALKKARIVSGKKMASKKPCKELLDFLEKSVRTKEVFL